MGLIFSSESFGKGEFLIGKINIDPQEKTFLALKKIISDGIRPKLICFETDFYKEKTRV